jgi:TIR domain/Pentapeptide repeats (8 copies)
MDRDEALKLLKGGWQGIREWNRRRSEGETIPHLGGADLRGARLHQADLSGADLSGAILTDTDLTGADLRHANFNSAEFSGANLRGAACWRTVFADVDFSGTKGLGGIFHEGPSTVGIDTLFRSHGKIPEAFLRGCGAPETLIAYLPSIMGAMQPIQFYSCFISYSTKDQPFAERLYADLQGRGVRCWYAPEDLKIGEKIRVGIDESIRIHDKLLLVLSKFSVASDWVEKEVETAMEKERQQKRVVLFPIRLDDAVMKIETGWPADIRRSRNIGDFKKWKTHDTYQKAFERLLRDLKAEESVGAKQD